MKRFMISLVVLTLILFASSTIKAGENLIVFGWDGTGRPQINQLLNEGGLPNLQSLLDDGGTLVEIENITATYTVPGWTQVFTGQTYDQSMVFGNGDSQWFKIIPFDETIPAKLQKKIGWFASKPYWSDDCSWNPLCEIPLNANTYLRTDPNIEGDSYLLILGNALSDFVEASTSVDFFVGFLCNPDYYAHHYGSSSFEYLNQIKRCDEVLGRTIAKLQELGIDNKTQIIITSDHGFDVNATTHYEAPYSFLATTLPVQRRGNLRDIPITILDYFLIDWKSQLPFLRGNNLLEPESSWR